jgi:hypothetical protein
MGYSARYHVASLAAVFLALAVGILIGAGLGDDLVRTGTENLEASLKGDLTDARAEIADLEREIARDEDFSDAVYPALVADRLRAKRIGVVAFGGLDGSLRDDVRAALEPTGAGIAQVAVIREPPDPGGLREAVGKRLRAGKRHLGDFLTALGQQAGRGLVAGAPVYDRLREPLLSGFSGGTRPLDGVIVVRSRPTGLGSQDEAASGRIEDGMIEGMTSAAVPVVGAQRTDAEDSSVGYFESHGLSTVDDSDLVAGRVALVYALGGAQGNFGVGSNADSLLPEPLRTVGR